MKKKILIILAVLSLVLVAALYSYQKWYDSTHVEIEGANVLCDITELTLSGSELPSMETLHRLTQLETLDIRSIPVTLEQYDQLCQEFPQLEILWLVPFQGSYLSQDTTELTITSLSTEDLRALSYFANLETVHADDCRDYKAIQMLLVQQPHVEVRYSILIGGQEYSPDTTHLMLENADGEALYKVLPYLPQLQEVVFTGTAPDNELIYQMMCSYPNVQFQWDLSVFGVDTSNMATTLILSGIPMDGTAELESYLRFFPNLERVEVCDCGIPSEDMDVLSKRYPDIRFVWTIRIGTGTLRTDVTAFIPYKLGYTLYHPLVDSDCTELKYCIDMVCLDMGHMDIYDFSFLEYMPKLKYLIVADTPCTDFSAIATLKELIYLEIFVTDFTQHDILLNLTKLEDLNLGTTPTNDISVLKQMTWLKRLWLPGTKLNYLQIEELYEALPNTRIVVYAEHSTDKGWRQAKNYYDMRDLLGMFYME